jgi:hypothetical protein
MKREARAVLREADGLWTKRTKGDEMNWRLGSSDNIVSFSFVHQGVGVREYGE